jgi:DedD protein
LNNILKQRLVGALILVALGVVFWPIIFVEPDDRSRDVSQRMPPPPTVDTSPIPPPDKAGLRDEPLTDAQVESREREQRADPDSTVILVADEPPLDERANKELDSSAPDADAVVVGPAVTKPVVETRIRSEAPVKPQVDAQGVPVAWILQVASVSDRSKANELRDALLSMDEKAYVKQVKRGDQKLYRIYVGPKFEQAKLDALKPKVDARFKVNSMVVRYVP